MPHTDPDNPQQTELSADLQQLLEARHHDPFNLLGRHTYADRDLVRVFIPGAAWVRIVETAASLERVGNTDIFEWHGPAGAVPERYRLIW
ncbi:MAG: 1,4-alpha-glucan branching enzyme, partial [Gammaproteobacteria bacterium]|nr:1,4-alpha-glucan branching enzyme [Gammaproteobacteria bacterium]